MTDNDKPPFPEETTNQGKTDKVVRYNWGVQDSRGEYRKIHKDDILVPEDYQRPANIAKARTIASNWSWAACGAILVAERDGKTWSFDGQHRVLGARFRSDIEDLDCMVFQSTGIRAEARAFLATNTLRKAPTAGDKFKALIVAEDPVALFANDLFLRLGLEVRNSAKSPCQIACTALVLEYAAAEKQRLAVALTLCANLAAVEGVPIGEKLLAGLWYLDSHCIVDGELALDSPAFVSRIRKIGYARLLRGAQSASAYFANGGSRVWAVGMLEELNKGLRKTFILRTRGIDREDEE